MPPRHRSCTLPGLFAAAALLLEDERRFIDLERSPLWWSHERPILG